MIFTKDLVGKNIYAIPTGNNARGKSEKIETFKVISVAKRYASLAPVDDKGNAWTPDDYCTMTGATKKSVNSGYTHTAGYKFFETLDALADYRHFVELAASLDEQFRWRRAASLTRSQIERILAILAEVAE